jgi:uncharacterized protein
MANFTPYPALIGGILIGLSAALLMLFNGRIAGISGILGGLVALKSGDMNWRFAFLLGLLFAPLILMVFGVEVVSPEIQGSWPLWVLSGLLVGYGTKLAKGCTSGHGVCGLARLSWRSMVATLLFMGIAGLTVYAQQHLFS